MQADITHATKRRVTCPLRPSPPPPSPPPPPPSPPPPLSPPLLPPPSAPRAFSVSVTVQLPLDLPEP